MSGAVIVLAILAQTSSTSTSAETSSTPITLDDIPLTEEDLRLIEQLDQKVTTETAAPAALPERRTGFGLAAELAQQVEGASLRETIGRSLGEALAAKPTLAATRRDRLPDDRPVLRGRSGTRLGLVLDGVTLHHPLSTVWDDEVWGVIDPWMIDQMTVRSGAALIDDGDRPAGAIHLRSREPRLEKGLRTEVQADLRSADRSTGGRAAIEGGVGAAALRVAGGYGDYKSPRFAVGGEPIDAAFQRANVALRSLFFGRADDLVGVTLGFDFDRLTNVRRKNEGIVREQSRRLIFGRLEMGKEGRSVAVLVAQQQHLFERSARLGDSERSSAAADTIEARVDGRFAILEGFAIVGGGDLSVGNAKTGNVDGGTNDFSGYVGLVLDSWRLRASLLGRFTHANTHAVFRSIEESAFLTEGRAEASILENLAFGAGWCQSFHLPNSAEWHLLTLDRADDPKAERTFTADAGPVLKLDNVTISLLGFISWVQNNIEPVEPENLRLIAVDEVRLYGVESRADFRATDHLSFGGALSWASGRLTDLEYAVSGQNGLTMQANLRYDFSEQRGYFEASVRGGIPTSERSPFDRERQPNERAEHWISIGARGGAKIGAGFELLLALENALDARYLTYGSSVPATGIDLRAALRHTFE